MFPANVYVIRPAGDADEDALRALAQLDSAAPLEHPILLGELDGKPAAAIELDTRRAIADPFKPTAKLLSHLRVRVAALDAYAQRPDVADRIRHALRRKRIVPA